MKIIFEVDGKRVPLHMLRNAMIKNQSLCYKGITTHLPPNVPKIIVQQFQYQKGFQLSKKQKICELVNGKSHMFAIAKQSALILVFISNLRESR